MSGQPRPSLRRPPSPPDEPPRLRVLNLTRFTAIQAPHPLEWLTDNGSVYTAKESRDFAMAINLVPCFTPVQSPESNGISESFVKTFKRDYVRIHPLPDALTALQQDRRMVRGQPSTFRAQNALPTGVHPSPNTIAECPVKQGQLHGRISASELHRLYPPVSVPDANQVAVPDRARPNAL
jgi:hypothetical protein